MSRPIRILRNVVIAFGAAIVVLAVAAILIVQSARFQHYVKRTIIASVEDSTGGSVEIGSFRFDWRHLSVTVANFVIHGTEPPGVTPMIDVPRLQLYLRFFTSMHHLWDITYLGIDRPEANVIVYPDGHTNIPSPRQKPTSSDPLQTVVDLAIRRFELTNGMLTFASQTQPLNVRANNFIALLSYNVLNQQYAGQLSLQPIYVASGRNTPVVFTVKLPVVISRNAIDVRNADISSSNSTLALTASVRDLKNPKLSAHATGHIALADLKAAANLPLSLKAENVPSAIDLDVNASNSDSTIKVAALRLTLGHSKIEATGSLDTGLTFNSELALGELGKLLNENTLPNEKASLKGTARLDSRKNLAVTGIRASALGGELVGQASLENSKYTLRGDLSHFNIANAVRALGQTRLPYDGVVSGPISIGGDLNAGIRTLRAQAKLSIAPGRQGIPLSGNLNTDYSGARDDLSIQKSVLMLPHSRVSVDGFVSTQLNVAITTSNFDDLLAIVPSASRPALALHNGEASFSGRVTGGVTAPKISGHLMATRFSIEGRQFDNFNADVFATNRGVVVQNGKLSRNTMQAQLAGTVGLRDWKPVPSAPLTINASIENGDLADLLVLAGKTSAGYSGQLSANAALKGTVGNPEGPVAAVLTNGTVQGQPFDHAEAQIDLTDQCVTVPSAFIQLGSGRLDINAQFTHPRDSFTMGQLRASVQSNQINLAHVAALQKQHPNTGGIVEVHANVTGNLSGEFQLTSLDGNVSMRGLLWKGQNYGDLTANATTNGQTVNYNVTSDFARSNIAAKGSTQLTREYPTMASINIANLPIERLLAVANHSDVPIKGTLSGRANFSGTVTNPTGSADLMLANGMIYDDSVDHANAHITYEPQRMELSRVEVVSGRSRLDLSARYDHATGDLRSGNLDFRLATNSIDLARVKTLTEQRPGLAGRLLVDASGAAQVNAVEPRILLRDLNGEAKTTGLALNGKNLGDTMLTASTVGGRTNFTLSSQVAGASIEGHGSSQLTADYPTEAKLTFKNITWDGLRPLLGIEQPQSQGFDAVVDGQISVDGPLTNIQQLRGSAQLTRVELSSAPSTFGNPNRLVIANQGPITASFDTGIVRIQSAHLAGPQTDFQATGTVPLNGGAMNVAVNGNVGLAILHQINSGITSSGVIVIAAGVRGSPTNPQLTGQVQLQNASFDYTSLPTGIWNANGIVGLSGNSVVIRSLTAQSGGGQLNVTGSATLGGVLRFGIQAKATRVRIMAQQGVGLVASATINLAGSPENSSITGTVTVDRISYSSQSDVGSMLSLAAPPVQTPSAPSPLLENMRLDIRVRSSSALGVQSSMAENVQLTTDLRVRGTAANPSVLGRVQITEGKLLFFGSTYTVNTGTISFFNPVRIEPILDLSLETKAQSVDVTLKVTGPIDNMKLSYTSDPPLPFQEIVGLLATGSTPISDPTLLANQRSVPAQNFQQMGESAIVSKALADPVANQLQRVFGVTQLKINPAFTSGSQLPGTQLSLTQRISSNITFNYGTGLNTANAQTIEVLWTFTPQWSAQALRDYNGIFSVTLTYKRQFR